MPFALSTRGLVCCGNKKLRKRVSGENTTCMVQLSAHPLVLDLLCGVIPVCSPPFLPALQDPTSTSHPQGIPRLPMA